MKQTILDISEESSNLETVNDLYSQLVEQNEKVAKLSQKIQAAILFIKSRLSKDQKSAKTMK